MSTDTIINAITTAAAITATATITGMGRVDVMDRMIDAGRTGVGVSG
jgi:hypothetical protein